MGMSELLSYPVDCPCVLPRSTKRGSTKPVSIGHRGQGRMDAPINHPGNLLRLMHRREVHDMTGGAGTGKTPSLGNGDHKEIRQPTKCGTQGGRNWQPTGRQTAGPCTETDEVYSSTRSVRNTTGGGASHLAGASDPKTDRPPGGQLAGIRLTGTPTPWCYPLPNPQHATGKVPLSANRGG